MVESNSDPNWLPLESNPEIINDYVEEIGFDTSKYLYYDMLGLEDWAQDMIPKPVLAVMFLYPIKEETEKLDEDEKDRILKEGQVVSDKLFYMKQYARNACGTVAILHVMMNIIQEKPELIKPGSFLAKFWEENKNKTPEERGNALKKAESLEEAHKKAVEQGATECDDDVNTHFIGFALKDGCIYELDGRKEFPINHGKSSEESFLKDACLVLNKFMARDEGEIRFTILVLARSESVGQVEEEGAKE